MSDALAARGVDAVLVPFRVAADDLPAVVTGLRAVRRFAGAIVTMPHEAATVPLLDDAAGIAPGTSAAEVVIRAEPTPFLAEAARRGAAVHGGAPMLAAQIDLMIGFMPPWQDPLG